MNYTLDEIPRGQLNNVILTTLLDGDKYGYEIIEEIANWSNNKIELKQPSLYSALKRLEAGKMLSSYWTESELGGNRHYYRLTDLGRKTASAWADKFMQIKEETIKATPVEVPNQSDNRNNNQDFTILDQGNIFQLINKNKENEIKLNETKQEQVNEDKLNDLQYNLFDKIPVQEEKKKEEKIEKAARIANINSKSQLVQLKQFTESDRKSEFEKLKTNNKSFLYNSIKNEKIAEKKEDFHFINENQKNNFSNLEEKKEVEKEENSIANEIKKEDKIESTFNISKYSSARDGYFLTNDNQETQKDNEINITKPESNVFKNDGIFLNDYETVDELPKVKKIEPMSLNIEIPSPHDTISFKTNNSTVKVATESTKINNQEKTTHNSRPSFSSYMGLKNYYNHLGIQFDEYKKVDNNKKINNNQIYKTNIIRSAIFLLISIILSFSFNFGINHNMYGKMSFIIIPIIILIINLTHVIIYIDANKLQKIKISPINITSNLYSIITSICLIIVSLSINLMLGFNFSNFIEYIPTLVYPIIMLALITIIPQLNKLILYVFNKKIKNS